MTHKVMVVSLSKTIDEVSKIMKKHEIGSVIVVDENENKHAKGIITERDIVYKILAKKKDPYSTKAEDIMSKPLRVVKADTTVEDAAKAMRENRIKRLPVVNNNNELVGVVSEGDIMRIFPAVVDLIEERVSL